MRAATRSWCAGSRCLLSSQVLWPPTKALAAREKLAAEVCQAQEEREEDLEQFAVRLQQQEEVRNVIFRKGF